ncbi:phosphoribosylanthranilate isomerase [Tumebacillus sp. BK434]|uniref:phosphoribosylanthranilate isomerase n=1 Tax=Tumebacillus sp. BK434 TaxID=2512169 RepID=UPI001053D240|nr:phosphoribosylanthranilate isomerase [Tumebacillus sp. BK434]TCP59086.1 phosphoribosylanthranilate isomerase [Tumebacillus sp. BK434]
MTRIKICGLKLHETIRHVGALPIEYVGFVFAPSKRQVSAETAAELSQQLPGSVQRAGVFVNESAAQIKHIAETAGLHVLQLHGDESPEFCRELKRDTGRLVWKAWGVCGDERDAELRRYAGVVDAVLLDNERGGTGTAFSWERIPELRSYLNGTLLYVAGGLHPDNVSALIETYRPDGVDVSSGVETVGVKDPDKITAFVTKVREQR